MMSCTVSAARVSARQSAACCGLLGLRLAGLICYKTPMRRIHVSSQVPWESEVGYSRLVKVGRQIWVSGTTDATAVGACAAPGDAYAQTINVFRKIDAALSEVGAGLSDIVRTRMFVVRIADNYRSVARAHKELFGKTLPAASMIEVNGFVDPQMLIEVEVDAIEGLSHAQYSSPPRIVDASFDPDSDLAAMLRSVDLPLPADADTMRMLKAYVGGELVGCVGCERFGASALLHSLVVIREAKGEGVGRSLVDTLLARLREAGVTQVFLVTTDTAQYFRYFGFQVVDKLAVDPAVLAAPAVAAYDADDAIYMRCVLGRRSP
jgi:enamine deaminase RidA (YjgF/YER057c/UK114 family)/N-acetylglutamate synthase-like GNAT family acetyltransferase